MLPKHVLLAVLGAMTTADASVLKRDSPFARTLSRRQDGGFGGFGGGGFGGGGGGFGGGGNGGNNDDNGGDNGGDDGGDNGDNNNNNDNGDNGNNNDNNNNGGGGNTCLQDDAIQDASASTGQEEGGDDGQAESAT